MFLHLAWIFHPEPCVAPINSTEPLSLQSAQLCSPPHSGWLAHADGLPLHLSAKTAIFHRAVSGVTGSLSKAPHTSSSLAFSLPRVEPTTRLRESRHVVCATVPRPRDISCRWYCDIFCDWIRVVSHDPSKTFVAMVLMPWWQCSSLAQRHVRLATGKLITQLC